MCWNCHRSAELRRHVRLGLGELGLAGRLGHEELALVVVDDQRFCKQMQRKSNSSKLQFRYVNTSACVLHNGINSERVAEICKLNL